MTVDLAEPKYIHQMNICSYFTVDDEEVREELFHDLKNVRGPDSLPYRDIYTDPNEIEDFEMTYSAGTPETPPPSHKSYFRLNIDQDGDFHVHIYPERELLEDLLDMFVDVIDVFEGPILLRQIGSSATLEKSFSELGFEKTVAIEELFGEENSPTQNLTGIRVAHGPYDVDIVPQGDSTVFSHGHEIRQEISNQEEIENIVESHIDFVDEFLEGVAE